MEGNNSNKFDAKRINFLKDIKKKEEIYKNEMKINALVEYVKSKYEEKIEKAIEKDYKTSSIKIVIPKKYRVFDESAFAETRRKLNDVFYPLGLSVTLVNDICDCILKFICCSDDYYVKIVF